ncbi:hypothetical protein ACJX0J_016543, partial [Zea mays]
MQIKSRTIDLFAYLMKKKLMINERGKSHARNIKLLLTVFEQIYFAMGGLLILLNSVEEAVKGNIGWLGGIFFLDWVTFNRPFCEQFPNLFNTTRILIYLFAEQLRESTLIILLGLGQLLFTGISALFWWHLIKNQYHQLMYINKLSICNCSFDIERERERANIHIPVQIFL